MLSCVDFSLTYLLLINWMNNLVALCIFNRSPHRVIYQFMCVYFQIVTKKYYWAMNLQLFLLPFQHSNVFRSRSTGTSSDEARARERDPLHRSHTNLDMRHSDSTYTQLYLYFYIIEFSKNDNKNEILS